MVRSRAYPILLSFLPELKTREEISRSSLFPPHNLSELVQNQGSLEPQVQSRWPLSTLIMVNRGTLVVPFLHIPSVTYIVTFVQCITILFSSINDNSCKRVYHRKGLFERLDHFQSNNLLSTYWLENIWTGMSEQKINNFACNVTTLWLNCIILGK